MSRNLWNPVLTRALSQFLASGLQLIIHGIHQSISKHRFFHKAYFRDLLTYSFILVYLFYIMLKLFWDTFAIRGKILERLPPCVAKCFFKTLWHIIKVVSYPYNQDFWKCLIQAFKWDIVWSHTWEIQEVKVETCCTY